MTYALIVEGDPMARVEHLQVLQNISGVGVTAVASAQEARALLGNIPRILIIDHDLPEVLEIVDIVRQAREPACLLALTHTPDQVDRSKLGPSARVLKKPVSPERLLSILRRTTRLTIDARSTFQPAELLQLACVGRHSVDIVCQKGRQSCGRLLIWQGELWAAFDDEGDGEDAFVRVVTRTGVTAQVFPLEDAGVRNLNNNWQHLLLEAARVFDEAEAQTESVEDLVRDGGHAILRGDLAQAAELFHRAAILDPSNPVVQHNLQRLKELGWDASSE